MCTQWARQTHCPHGSVAIAGECWRLGEINQDCGDVCGGGLNVDIQGTTDGCWREDVVVCLNDKAKLSDDFWEAHHGLVAYDQLFDGLGTPCTVQTWGGTPSGALPPN
jgi:hypothetical protein